MHFVLKLNQTITTAISKVKSPCFHVTAGMKGSQLQARLNQHHNRSLHTLELQISVSARLTDWLCNRAALLVAGSCFVVNPFLHARSSTNGE